MRKFLILISALLLAAPAMAGEPLTRAERIQRLRVEYEEARILNTGTGYYERDMKRYAREVGTLDLIKEMVRECPEAVDLMFAAEELKKKRLIPWLGQGVIILGVFDTGEDGTFSSVLFSVSGVSWIITGFFNRKIFKHMDRAVEAYNHWLLQEIGLGDAGE